MENTDIAELQKMMSTALSETRGIAIVEQTACLIGAIKGFYEEKKSRKGVDYITEKEMMLFLSELLRLTKESV